ncbi:unnamed protein product [Ilex paraguariensis]|uniref:Uncharacterized protein n=1 Tax=Ilex paraguariensis TaxID=185542 RepID=A0ABC8T141_9AQUA
MFWQIHVHTTICSFELGKKRGGGRKERSALEQGHKVGELVIPLARTSDLESSSNSAVCEFQVASERSAILYFIICKAHITVQHMLGHQTMYKE